MSEPGTAFNIMAKPVCGICNLACGYCYYTSKPGELYGQVEKFLMDGRVLESYTRQYLQAQPLQCDFGWQGGEPTLAGLEFFQKAIDFQKTYAADGQKVSNSLQTNGTLLDDRWCEFLAGNGFLVGISIDGPSQWHDVFRRDAAGRPTFHRAWAGLELLRKHAVEFNVLVTLNSANAPHAGDIYRYFVNRGLQYLQFIPILEPGPGGKAKDFSCTAEQFGRFMLEVFDIWAARDVGKVSERFIDNCLHQLLFGQASMCCYADRCANAMVVEFNGDLYACDHFVFEQWLVGNIMDRPLAELVRDKRMQRFAELKSPPPAACRDCEYIEFCNGGCPKHHRPVGTDPDRVNYFCEGYKMFFRHALPELRRIAEYMRQDRTPPAQGRSLTATGKSPRPAGPAKPPGRNDPCPCGSGRKFKNCCGRPR